MENDKFTKVLMTFAIVIITGILSYMFIYSSSIEHIQKPYKTVTYPETSINDTLDDNDFELHRDADIDEEKLYLLAHLIYAEAGADTCSDTLQRYVGSVVLNRVASNLYPNDMESVIFQDGQYACTWDGNFEKEPDERAWENAKWIIVNGSQLPKNVVFQAGFEQGDGVYEIIQGTYFCYINE